MTSQVFSKGGTLAALNAAIGPLQLANSRATIFLDTGLTGSVELMARPTGGVGNFQPLIPIGASAAAITTAGVYAYPPLGGDFEYQLACTAFTSGSAYAYLGLGPA